MSQSPAVISPSTEAEQWFKAGNWKNGLNLSADPTTNMDEFYKQYQANKAGWDQGFAFLKDQDLENIKPGKYPIDGENVFAIVMEVANVEFEKTTWESHRKYIDIQYLIKGKELIGITTESNVVPTGDYDEKNDIIFYTGEGDVHSFKPDSFFIFFPQDLHRPCIKVEGFDPVKKIVIKVNNVG